MSKGKKINPRRRPATIADVEKAKKEAQDKGLNLAICIILSALLDRGFLDPEQMRPAWDAINDKSDSIIKGYCNVNDLRQVLREEYEIFV